MTSTKITANPKPNHVAAVTTVDGQPFGRVVMRGRKYAASRQHGDATDIRRYATGFGSVESAVAWVERAA